MARIAILANSKRPDGMCLAGIDLDTREWVRPVTRTGDGIPAMRCVVNGKMLSIRAILECDLIRPRTIAQFQCENQTIRNWDWQVKRRLKATALDQFVEDISPILHTPNDRVATSMLEAKAPSKWKSLQLVKPRHLQFGRHYYDPNRWVAEFADGDGNHYSLKITDPIITRRLEAGEKISKKCLLTVSMTKPWTHNPEERPPTCYKLVAAVIEL